MKLILLGSDLLLFLASFFIVLFITRALKRPLNRQALKRLLSYKISVITLSILSLYYVVAILDSIHFQRQLVTKAQHQSVQYSAKVESVLDLLFASRATPQEKTYSSPFALHSYLKELKSSHGQYYPKLLGTPAKIDDSAKRNIDILQQILLAFIIALACFAIGYHFISSHKRFELAVFSSVVFIVLVCILLENHYHILGTDKVGQDVFYQAVKSIRTGLVIGLITTLVTLPFAIILGLCAGFFGGRLDDLIQYIYITISSIPGVLLIAASVLSMQVFISNHPELFTSLMARSDARLIALCIILGLTGWTGLCRVLRAETLKLREIDYIQAAKVLGSSKFSILFKHILPNVMHLILIAVVLDFSFLVLAEAVLSYIGVGVSPLTISWGNMINGARMELAREPMVWWPMLAAFLFMFLFVISINLLADKVRDVFDPRTRMV